MNIIESENTVKREKPLTKLATSYFFFFFFVVAPLLLLPISSRFFIIFVNAFLFISFIHTHPWNEIIRSMHWQRAIWHWHFVSLSSYWTVDWVYYGNGGLDFTLVAPSSLERAECLLTTKMVFNWPALKTFFLRFFFFSSVFVFVFVFCSSHLFVYKKAT